MKQLTAYQVILRPLVTEKAVEQSRTENTYWFAVTPEANKTQIRQAVEEIYQVHVRRVNTSSVKGKSRRMRFKVYKETNWKKAAVTLPEGERIDII
jgi:large subunit ribosomal protein L23